MFPLLDLDDDALVATLGFSDPRTLCAATMNCRRLRTLADAAWAILDKGLHLQEKYPDHYTPRERVLDHFLENYSSWLDRISGDPHQAGLSYTKADELLSQNYVLYVQISTVGGETHVDSLRSMSRNGKFARLVADNNPADIPLLSRKVKDQLLSPSFKKIVEDRLLIASSMAANGGTLSPRNFVDAYRGLTKLDITILTIDCQTLTPKIFFKNDEKHSPRPIIRPIRLQSGSYRLDICHVCLMKVINDDGSAPIVREAALSFRKDKFSLIIRHPIYHW